jgi:hypothetical protein
VKELSTTMISTRAGSNMEDAGAGGEKTVFPVITKMLKMLEKKKQKDLARNLSGNENVEDHLLEVNQVLREELATARSRLDELETEIQASHKLAASSQKDAESLRLRAAKARGKVLELPAELLLGSVHDYSAVVEQLIECLLELQVKDKELKECRSSLDRFNVRMKLKIGNGKNNIFPYIAFLCNDRCKAKASIQGSSKYENPN